MSKIRTLIIDDEQLARDIIKAYLRKLPNYHLIGEATNGFDGIKLINETKPDLVFLDIQMPKLTGFEMLELLEEQPYIIFTTAFDQYALKAFEVNATDYLLKPFSEERFFEALNKIEKLLGNKSEIEKKIKSITELAKTKNEYLERVVFKLGQKIIIISIEDINFIEAQDDYTMLHTTKGNFLKQKTMKYFEENLDPKHFLRLHRSYIVKLANIKQIELFEKDSYQVILTDGEKIPVSKSGYQKVKEILNR